VIVLLAFFDNGKFRVSAKDAPTSFLLHSDTVT
jgi:hypothetical protein